MRIFATSDLHTDFKENWLLLEQLSNNLYQEDILIVAGDIAHNLDLIKNTLVLLKHKFKKVFYVPGNHELWVRGEELNSIEKFSRIVDLCKEINVDTQAVEFENVAIVPLFSWYEATFDSNITQENELVNWSDFYFCQWPKQLNSIVSYFLDLNKDRIKAYSKPVISFSHFLPRQELLPSREWLKFKALPQVSGSLAIDEQIRQINSKLHIFGHSHINWDVTIDGVRYVQNALSYPRERVYREKPTIKLIWSDVE